MKPTILEKGRILLVGFGFFGDPFQLSGGWTEENEIGRTWQRFMTYLEKHRPVIEYVVSDHAMYEVHIYHEETTRTGEFEVFVGVEVQKLENLPPHLLVKILPPTTYAVFTLEGEQIISDWSRMIYTDWMSESEYQNAYDYSIQRYDERFKGLEHVDESLLEVYIPVKRREQRET